MVLFSHICWIEKYKKNWYWTVVCKFCFVSDLTFIMRRSEKFSFSGQHKMAGNTIREIRCKFWWNFGSLKLALSKSSMKYVVAKLNNSLTVSGHFVLADKLSLTWREFCLLSQPHDESKIWYKANTVIVCLRVFLDYSIYLMWENNTKFLKTNLEYWWFLFSIDSKNFFLTYVHVKMLT